MTLKEAFLWSGGWRDLSEERDRHKVTWVRIILELSLFKKKQTMKDFWNQRYADEKYAYGIEPNEFFKSQLEKLSPGALLLPAEGEGRNVVYAASQGWKVTAFDFSVEGQKKALRLAEKQGVEIEYLVASYEEIKLPAESFDCIALTYAHMSAEKREPTHKKLVNFLKPGGALILEGFSKDQIHNNTGGPKNLPMLFSREELESDFIEFSSLEIEYAEVHHKTGLYHEGKANIIQLLGIK